MYEASDSSPTSTHATAPTPGSKIAFAKDTGLDYFPSRSFAINQVWLTVVMLAVDLIAWTQHLLRHGHLAKAEPKSPAPGEMCRIDLTGATITGLPTDLTGLKAHGLRLPKGDFTGFVLDGADFSSATLDLAMFTGAKLRAHGTTPATFDQDRLMGASFTEAGARPDPLHRRRAGRGLAEHGRRRLLLRVPRQLQLRGRQPLRRPVRGGDVTRRQPRWRRSTSPTHIWQAPS